MTGTEPETSETGERIAADELTDEQVAAHLGLTEPGDTPDEGEQDSRQTINDLPQWAQDEITKARRQAAQARIRAREARQASRQNAPAESSQQTIDDAREAGRKEARAEFAVKLARAEVRGALAGVVPDENLDDVLDDLNFSNYLDENDDVDAEAVTHLRERYTSLLGAQRQRPGRVQHGKQTKPPTNKSAADLFADALGM
jgi:hypothetical protein